MCDASVDGGMRLLYHLPPRLIGARNGDAPLRLRLTRSASASFLALGSIPATAAAACVRLRFRRGGGGGVALLAADAGESRGATSGRSTGPAPRNGLSSSKEDLLSSSVVAEKRVSCEPRGGCSGERGGPLTSDRGVLGVLSARIKSPCSSNNGLRTAKSSSS